MSAFDLLSPQVQKYIFDLKWGSLSPIQEEAIPAVIERNKHILLCAGTASGKTEAAFLPVLSNTLSLARERLAVLHVLPLKALINDQFYRIEAMCEYGGVEVMKWHGDVSASRKKAWLKDPKGILQITPESLESLLMNHSSSSAVLWSNLSYIIIDEAHVFFGSERGIQLRSLLDRVSHFSKITTPRIIALSATVNDENNQVQKWIVGDEAEDVEYIEANAVAKPLLMSLIYASSEDELTEDLASLTSHMQSMIFCNSRSDAESVYGALSNRRPGEYLIHHSSIDAEEREKTEKKMKQKQNNKSIVCTGTLEMGIDLGAVDLVVQKEGAFSVSSLKQRIGRTGRRAGKPQMMQMYVTTKESLLRAIATTNLLMEKWVEPPMVRSKPYDVLLQQILSLILQKNEVSTEDVIGLKKSHVFEHITSEEALRLLEHMEKNDLVENVHQRYILGLSGEELIKEKGLYSVFAASEQIQLFHGNQAVGVMDKSFALEEGKSFLLAGRSWKIMTIAKSGKKAFVSPAPYGTGETPIFNGGSMDMHKKIGEMMMDVLTSHEEFTYIDEEAKTQLSILRRLFHKYALTKDNRLVIKDKKQKFIYVFKGSMVAQTLVLMLKTLGYQARVADELYSVKVERTDEEIQTIFDKIMDYPWEENRLWSFATEKEKKIGKFTDNLPQEMQNEMTIEEKIDIEETLTFIQETIWVEVDFIME